MDYETILERARAEAVPNLSRLSRETWHTNGPECTRLCRAGRQISFASNAERLNSCTTTVLLSKQRAAWLMIRVREARLVAVSGYSLFQEKARDDFRLKGWVGATEKTFGREWDKGHFIAHTPLAACSCAP